VESTGESTEEQKDESEAAKSSADKLVENVASTNDESPNPGKIKKAPEEPKVK